MLLLIVKPCGSGEPYGGRVRYLAESFILGALRRGRSVEQFLGPCGSAERPGVRCVAVRATKGPFEVYLHVVEDVGSESFLDLGEFPPFDPDDESGEFGRLLGMAEDPLAALDVAEQRAGAERDRWINEGVVQDEYGDFVRAGRPTGVSADGRRWPAVPDVA
ncbi:hypothetical protein ACF06D_19315 [Streptomyces griseoluteus]|uniref:hypothetical protein n=1 Tax=Streptomyces griseoluteus TaxID=29306 RepID=UPI0037031272